MTRNIDKPLDRPPPEYIWHELRLSPRRNVNWQGQIKDREKNTFIPVVFINISQDGALIETTKLFQKNISYHLMISASFNSHQRNIYAVAEVRHIMVGNHCYQYGVQFKKILADNQKILAAFSVNLI